MLFYFEIPISNYEGNDSFGLHVYIEADHCPSKDEVLAVLKTEHEKELETSKDNPEFGPFLFEYGQAMETINSIDDFPTLSENQILDYFSVSTKWGDRPILVPLG